MSRTNRQKVRPGDPSRPTEYRGHGLLYVKARDQWLVLDRHGIQVASGITLAHARWKIDAILAANPSLAKPASQYQGAI